MNWTFIVGATCGALAVVAAEALMIIVWTFKVIKDGILDETSEVDSEKI